MDHLRSAIFAIVFWGLSVPVVLAAPIAALFGQEPLRRHVWFWLKMQRWAAKTFLNVETRVEGEIPQGQVLIAAKHQSMYETFELSRIMPDSVMVMKHELSSIPVWGWAARTYGMIPIDRGASAAAMRTMMRGAKVARESGRSVVIFPEGTRVTPGETPPLKPGFSGLYRALGLPVVPVALDSGRRWPRKGPKHTGPVIMRFGPVIPPGLPREEVEAAVYAGINALEK